MEIHKMKLHETITLTGGIVILRVPDYWIYTFPNGTSQKIKFTYEFSNKKNRKVTKEDIAKIISNYYNLPGDFYKLKHGINPIGKAKRILALILHDELMMTHRQIAEFTKRRNESNSTLAAKSLKNELEYNNILASEYKEIMIEYERIKSEKN